MGLQISTPGRVACATRGVVSNAPGVAVSGARLKAFGRRAPAVANRLLMTALAAAVLVGWSTRGEGHLTAEEGLGYLLGIIGSVMMLMLLIYPLRKRMPRLRAIGSVRHWFRIHMMFGILGPTLILFHANFNLGSTNSMIASFSMTAVVLSGLIGRYLYGKVHYGLYGQRAAVRDLLIEAIALRPEIDALLASQPGLRDELIAFEQSFTLPPGGLLSSTRRSAAITRKLRRAEQSLLHQAGHAQLADGLGWRERRRRLAEIRYRVKSYFAAIRKVATLAVFERLLALWHVLHLPLFVMLILTAIMHVVAVHFY